MSHSVAFERLTAFSAAFCSIRLKLCLELALGDVLVWLLSSDRSQILASTSASLSTGATAHRRSPDPMTSPKQQNGTLSVLMPIYNEISTLKAIVSAVLAQSIVGELIAVDDGSSDGSRELLAEIAKGEQRIRAFYHEVNRGKGAALRTAIGAIRCSYVIIQDADLEYDPAEYEKLLAPLLSGEVDVVYGSRYATKEITEAYFGQYLANRVLTWLCNRFTGLRLTDMETCYKMFHNSILQSITIEEKGFGIEPEVTAKIAKLGVRLREVPIAYAARAYSAGKKIGWKDGVRTLACIVRYSLKKSS
jgi:glycosyltransferase involved in cell wall biosynthesis